MIKIANYGQEPLKNLLLFIRDNNNKTLIIICIISFGHVNNLLFQVLKNMQAILKEAGIGLRNGKLTL